MFNIIELIHPLWILLCAFSYISHPICSPPVNIRDISFTTYSSLHHLTSHATVLHTMVGGRQPRPSSKAIEAGAPPVPAKKENRVEKAAREKREREAQAAAEQAKRDKELRREKRATAKAEKGRLAELQAEREAEIDELEEEVLAEAKAIKRKRGDNTSDSETEPHSPSSPSSGSEEEEETPKKSKTSHRSTKPPTKKTKTVLKDVDDDDSASDSVDIIAGFPMNTMGKFNSTLREEFSWLAGSNGEFKDYKDVIAGKLAPERLWHLVDPQFLSTDIEDDDEYALQPVGDSLSYKKRSNTGLTQAAFDKLKKGLPDFSIFLLAWGNFVTLRTKTAGPGAHNIARCLHRYALHLGNLNKDYSWEGVLQAFVAHA